MTSTAAALLMDRLGLTEDELGRALGSTCCPSSPASSTTSRSLHPPGADRGGRRARGRRDAAPVGPGPGPGGRPIDHLLARDYGAFEDALGALADRGFVLRRAP